MTDTSGLGPTVAKRRLSRRLTELRKEHELSANQVCDKLDWGRGKVGRFEANDWKRPEKSDLREMLRLYGAPEDGPVWNEILSLADLARQSPWFRKYNDIFEDSEYPGYEADAARISLYMPLILPALLQTEAYAEAQMRVAGQKQEWINRSLLTRRLRKRACFERAGGPPEVVAVITEAALSYRWGTAEQCREQIEELLRLARRPEVQLHVLRFRDGLHPAMSSLISLFEFPDKEPSLGYLEVDNATPIQMSQEEVQRYTEIFNRVQKAALDSAGTTDYLKSLLTRQ